MNLSFIYRFNILLLLFVLSSCASLFNKGPVPREDLIEVKASDIPGAGKGVFAKKDIPAGTYIGYYHGKRLTKKEADFLRKDKKHYYLFWLSDCPRNLPENIGFPYIDGDQEHYVSKVNYAPSTINEEETYLQNVGFYHFCNEPYIRLYAVENVKAGEELYVSYGDSYGYDEFMQRKEVQDFFLQKSKIEIPKGKKFTYSN